MTDSTADNQQGERSDSADTLRPGEEKQVRAAARELATSLEARISRLNIRLAFLFPILLIGAIVLTSLVSALLSSVEAPVWVFVPCFMIALLLPLVLGIGLPEFLLVRRAGRLIAQRFPEGSPERQVAIAMLSEIKTRHKVRQRLLQALGAPEIRARAVSGREQLVLGASILLCGLVARAWEIAAREWGLDEKVRELVAGAILGTACGVLVSRAKQLGLDVACLVVALALVAGVPDVILVFLASLFLVMTLVMMAFDRFGRMKTS